MVVLDIVLRLHSGILYPLFVQEVHCAGLLQERIAHILLVFKYLTNRCVMPFCLSAGGQDAVTL